ncbi:SdpI family protein [Thermostaphylospora chromogena]|uniref:SdpI/YhfL protein family protein n=1 Tax=Thermostaphylospora chromogena TaxID=35622 RepID=A0A1H1CZS6_9ACTN|nr:SdpI family protein [Thermostaphylospora chromogena]SDQ69755.1 SdpI/YhfL protein family protein [Thermostaphylospora chromogena]
MTLYLVDEPLQPPGLIFTAAICGATALLVLGMGILGILRKIRPNMLFGIRTALTLDDPDAWDYVHRKAAPWAIAAGLSLLIATVVICVAPSGDVQFWAAMAGSAAVVVLLMTGVKLAQRSFARQRDGNAV